MKKIIITIFIVISFITIPAALFAEDEFTKVGVVDTNRIYTLYFKDSKAVRELNLFKESILEESKKIEEEIVKLKDRKLKAEQMRDENELLRLNTLIIDKERYLKEFKQIKNKDYQIRSAKTQIEDSFLQQISEAISYVAVSFGFSVILEKNNSFFLYYSIDIDITDKVLEYLQKNK
jgi:outer membrane protein